MLRVGFFFTAIALASAAVAAPPGRPLTPAEKAHIEDAVRAKLLDPVSAQFRLGPDHALRPDNSKQEDYCGLVNA